MARRRKLSAGSRRVRKANAVLAGGMKLAASFASTALQAMIPTVVSPAAKKRAPQKRASVNGTARSRKAAPPVRVIPASSFRAGLHHCEHGSRSYKLFKPGAALVSDKPPALLVMLHGCGQTPDDLSLIHI